MPVPSITISPATPAVAEDGAHAYLAVNLSNAYNQPVSVTVSTADGTASAGGDYYAQTSTLVFNPGEMSKSLTLGLIPDTQIEPNETFQVNLLNPINGTIGAGKAIVTILNDDTSVGLGVATQRVLESQGQVAFAVTLAAPSTLPVTVVASTSDGTAHAGTDYVATTQTLTFNPGETIKYVAVPIVKDKVYEPVESFNIKLSNAVNASIGVASGVCTIRDRAPAGFDFDGDGRSDLASYRTSDGVWSIRLSSSGQGIPIQWGGSDQVPVGGVDFDGDGRTDLASYRTSDGVWSIRLSSNGQGIPIQWGGPDQVPVGGMDFDGDGRSDLASYRTSDGVWSIRLSSSGQGIPIQWGGSDQSPVTLDPAQRKRSGLS